jgi:pimeloyl-ACP methyl ester carboxylesterase
MTEPTIAHQAHLDGRGLPVVLLHGAAGTHLSWPAQVRRLPGCRVYALDLPGHGKSGGEACSSISEYTRRVLAWIEALDLQRAIFVGHSMGSAVAMQAALTEPAKVAALVLVGSASQLKVNPALMAQASSPETYLQAVERIVAWSFSRQASERLVELVRKRMAETAQTVLQRDFQACDEFDISERLGEIEAPALVVCGADDRMTPLAGAQNLAGGLRRAHLEVAPNAGHMLMLEQPQAFATLLGAFIREGTHGGT